MDANSSLERFLQAQEGAYEVALGEVANGRKISHWMWYIFPQIKGLGVSETSRFYAINNLEEAAAYVQHHVLGHRLMKISSALMELSTDDPVEVFGRVDSVKLKSSMTLFSLVPDADRVFERVIDKFFEGKKDKATIKLALAA